METPHLAVTTVLLHAPAAHDPEVLLVRRPSSMAAFGDMWVFPGGRVDPADGAAPARAVLDAAGQAHADLAFLAAQDSCPQPAPLPLFTAACRELFEEVGLLFTVPAAPAGGGDHAALLARRADILADGARFYALLAAHGLRLDVTRLVPWSRWITPPARGRRFDTIFFVAATGDTALVPEAREIAGAEWLPLEQAIHEGLTGTRALMTPTLLTLMQIAAARRHHGSIGALLQSPAVAPLTPVQPRGVDVDGRHWIVFPWDADGGEAGTHGWRSSGVGEPVPGRLCAEY